MKRNTNNLAERDPHPAITLSPRKAQKLISMEINGVGSTFNWFISPLVHYLMNGCVYGCPSPTKQPEEIPKMFILPTSPLSLLHWGQKCLLSLCTCSYFLFLYATCSCSIPVDLSNPWLIALKWELCQEPACSRWFTARIRRLSCRQGPGFFCDCHTHLLSAWNGLLCFSRPHESPVSAHPTERKEACAFIRAV